MILKIVIFTQHWYKFVVGKITSKMHLDDQRREAHCRRHRDKEHGTGCNVENKSTSPVTLTLADQIQPLTGFDSLGLTVERQDGLTRRSFVEGTPPAFMTEVFEMGVGDVRVIDNGQGNGALIVRLNGIAPPQADDPQVEAERSAAANTASAGIAQDIFDAFATEIQSETEIRIDQTVLNALHTQFQ